MAVTFVYWGSHELLERLARSEHIGRVHFWLDVRGFDGAWFTKRLDEAVPGLPDHATLDSCEPNLLAVVTGISGGLMV
jgi:hypothetical protein